MTATIHGYLTLALLIPLWSELVEIRGARMSVNYGLNKVRFPAPVPLTPPRSVQAPAFGHCRGVARPAAGWLEHQK